MFVDVLPRWERCTYWIVGVSGVVYSIYNVFLEGDKYNNAMKETSFSSGWNWIGRGQDHNDDEWMMWRRSFPQHLLLCIVHVILSQTCFYFKVSIKLHTRVLLVFDLTAAYICFGIRPVVLQFIMALMMYAVSLFGSISLAWMMTLSYKAIYITLVKYLKFVHFSGTFQLHVMSAFFFSRLLSFAIEKIRYRKSKVAQTDAKKYSENYEDNDGLKSCNSSCEREKFITDANKQRKDGSEDSDLANLTRNTSVHIVDCDPSFIDLLFYSFYLPTFCFGPILLYSDFHTQVKHSFRSSDFCPDVYDIVKKLVKIAFWAIFIEFQFHFLYFSAIGLYPGLIDRLPILAVAGVLYCQGQYFMVKYFVIYGTAIQLFRFDGIIPYAAPRCFSWIYSGSDIWKHFDVGLYNFIKTYIYVPFGGSRAGLLRQILASAMAFIFIFYWHGVKERILIWCIGNYILLILEATTITLEHTDVVIRLKSYLGGAMWLRLTAFLRVPMFIAFWLQNTFLFFNVETALAIVRRLVTKASWTSLVTEYICVSAWIHNALYLNQWYHYKLMTRNPTSRN